MLTGGVPSQRLIIAVAACCLAAAASQISLGLSLFAYSAYPVGQTLGPQPWMLGPRTSLFLIMGVAAALAGAAGLLMLHWVRRSGWPWLLIAGSGLTGTLMLVEADDPFLNMELFFAILGASPMLTLLGLMGAGSWLLPRFRAAGSAVIGVATAAPLVGVIVLTAMLVQSADVPAGLRAWQITLASAGVAGGLGAVALVPALRRLPASDPPRLALTVAGIFAAALQVVPFALLHATYEVPTSPELIPNAEGSELVGIAGLVIFAVGIAVAAMLGNKALGVAMASGLVLYGSSAPISRLLGAIDSPAVAFLLAMASVALGVAALATPWRTWIAAGSGLVLGVLTLVMFADQSPQPFPISTVLAHVLLALALFTMVTTVGAVAGAVTDSAQLPVVIGALALIIQFGLKHASSLAHNDFFIDGNQQSPLALLAAAGGIALILAAALMLGMALTKEARSAQAEPEPVAR